jgi:ribosome-binding factor A
VGVLGDEAARRKGMEGLRSAAGFVRRELGRRLRLRTSPEVRFEYDKGLDATDRVARLLEGFGGGNEGEPGAGG